MSTLVNILQRFKVEFDSVITLNNWLQKKKKKNYKMYVYKTVF